MKFKDREKRAHSSICLSSQVGCSLKCAFCATGAAGFKRQLTVDEIVDQYLYFSKGNTKSAKEFSTSASTISFMGMGEALLNPRLFDALSLLTHKDFFNISDRKISVSTVGIIPGIVRLTKEFPSINLAFSLHTPFNEQRNILVPNNKLYPLEENLKVLAEHVRITRRKLVLAYLLLPSFNDTKEHADSIAEIIKNTFPSGQRHLVHLNLLRYNPIDDPLSSSQLQFSRTTPEQMKRFTDYLDDKNVKYTIRQSFGLDINAACGQLFNIKKKENS